MAQETKHLMDETDIGSGEKTPGQKDVEKDVNSVGNMPSSPSSGNRQAQQQSEQNHSTGKILQSGTHLARILAQPLPDGSYEAQVFVRLTREPEIAETYIPAGNFSTAAEAWKAAEQRAQRALREHEF